MNASWVHQPAAVGVLPTLPGPAVGCWAPAGGVEARPVATAHSPHPRPTWTFPRWQPPPGTGLIAVIAAAEATRGWVESLLAVDGSHQVVRAALGDPPEPQALELVEQFTVPVATLVCAGTDARQAWVALQVAAWLSGQRSMGGGAAGLCLTAWARPTPPPGVVRVPHLVSVSRGTTLREVVVWELVDVGTACQRVCLPPDWEFFDRHVPALLGLRTAVRTGRLPATLLARRMLELTSDCGGELSIELVYRNADLFRLIVQTWPTSTSGDGGGRW